MNINEDVRTELYFDSELESDDLVENLMDVMWAFYSRRITSAVTSCLLSRARMGLFSVYSARCKNECTHNDMILCTYTDMLILNF